MQSHEHVETRGVTPQLMTSTSGAIGLRQMTHDNAGGIAISNVYATTPTKNGAIAVHRLINSVVFMSCSIVSLSSTGGLERIYA